MKIESKTLKAFESCTSKDYHRKALNAIYVEVCEDIFCLVATDGYLMAIGEYSCEEQWNELQKVMIEDYGTRLPEKAVDGFIFLNKKTRKDHKIPCWVPLVKSEKEQRMEMQDYLDRKLEEMIEETQEEKDENQEEIEGIEEELEKMPSIKNEEELEYPKYRSVFPEIWESDFEDLEKPILSFNATLRVIKLSDLLGLPLKYLKFSKWHESKNLAKIEIPFDYQVEIFVMTYRVVEEAEQETL